MILGDGGQWLKNGVLAPGVIGHRFVGVAGLVLDGAVLIWNADGSLGGRWVRPKK